VSKKRKPFKRGGYTFGGKYFTEAEVDAIRAANLARRQTGPPVPSLEPLSAVQQAAMTLAGRGSGVIDPTRTATDPETIERLRGQFSGPGRSGFNALGAIVGRPFAYRVPGTEPPADYTPTVLGTAVNAAALLPTLRAARAGVRVAGALRRGDELGEAMWAGRASFAEKGPVPTDRQLWDWMRSRPVPPRLGPRAPESVQQLWAGAARFNAAEHRELQTQIKRRRALERAKKTRARARASR
jgi:hypothetical protein